MMNSKLGRILLASGLALLLMLFTWEVIADEMHIIEVRRNIPLSDHEPIYRDFYINAGLEGGLKANQVVTAFRKMNVKDASGTQSFGELLIPVGQLKIIYVQNRIAVAREYKLLSRDELPMLEQTGLMNGDLIDLKGSFIDNRKTSAKTSAQKETAPPSPVQAQTEGEDVAPATAQTVVQSMAEAMDRVSNKTE